MYDREKAYKLLRKYMDNERLLKHSLAVEAAMKAYAEKLDGDVDKWGFVGLIHDFDYQMYPDQHPYKGAEMLGEMGYPEDVVEAVLGHGDFTGVERKTPMAKALFAVDELTGFLAACALVRPSKDFTGMKLKSVKKKLKDRRFAEAISREGIEKGAQELGVDLGEHITFVIQALHEANEEYKEKGHMTIV